MKRIGIVSLVFLGVVLCSGIVAFTQGPPRGPGMPESGPKPPACGQSCGSDFQQAVQEAFERGFQQGFQTGLKARNELRGDAPKGEHFDRRGPWRDGSQGDFRGPGPRGGRFEGRDFSDDHPRRGFDQRGSDNRGSDWRGPDWRGERGPRGGFRPDSPNEPDDRPSEPPRKTP